MKTHRPTWPIRTLTRGGALGTFCVVLLGSGVASADAPSSWEDTPPVSGLHALTILFLIPLALLLVISLLAALPSLIKGDSYRSGQPWLSQPEWFGGPRGGVEGTDEADQKVIEPAENQGGAGARF